MDRHIRGYFSPIAKLLEVDSMLFERAVTNFDKVLANQLFVGYIREFSWKHINSNRLFWVQNELRLPAAEFCRHWFTTLFACALPESFLPRVWDTIMFFSGLSYPFSLFVPVAYQSCVHQIPLISSAWAEVFEAHLLLTWHRERTR